MKRLAPLAVLMLVVGCRHSQSDAVVSGELFTGPYISVKAPDSDDWKLNGRTDTAITFVKGKVGDTFVAGVLMSRQRLTDTPAEFEALVRDGAARDTDPNYPDRYELLEQSVAYSSERPYPCVRYRAVSMDKRAKGTKEAQFLELDGIYCRHPQDPAAVAAIMYTHRGLTRHPKLRGEAEDFIRNAHLVSK